MSRAGSVTHVGAGEKLDYLAPYNDGLISLLGTAARICAKDPSQAAYMLKVMNWQRRAQDTRARWEKQGVHVPPFMIISVTSSCNLHCKGCYAHAQARAEKGDMDDATLTRALDEGRELGISVVMLAGGEPLVRKGLLDVAARYPEIIFPMFTNGVLIDGAMADRLRRLRNVVPVISVEGRQDVTDDRRGDGVWARISRAAVQLQQARVFFGASLTVRRDTVNMITSDEFVSDFVSSGCRIFFFVEYVPVEEGTQEWELTPNQRGELMARVESLRSRMPALFVAFPGDEEATGGCLAAGRGFVHISSGGDVEPCPFAPYSDASLGGMSLKDALNSSFLKSIRDHHEELGETTGGCALFRRRELVAALLSESQRR
ncbi:MAG: radical SAM protein [Clostridia bacterium]|nr:radical SAM protein [Clostridia bacterium]